MVEVNKKLIEKCLPKVTKKVKELFKQSRPAWQQRDWNLATELILTKAIPIIAEEYELKGYAKGCGVTTMMFSEAKSQALKAQADSIKREVEEKFVGKWGSDLMVNIDSIPWQDFWAKYLTGESGD